MSVPDSSMLIILANELDTTVSELLGEPVAEPTTDDEYYGAAEPPVRCGESHLSGLTEPPHFVY